MLKETQYKLEAELSTALAHVRVLLGNNAFKGPSGDALTMEQRAAYAEGLRQCVERMVVALQRDGGIA